MTALYKNLKRICRERYISFKHIEYITGLPRNTIPKWRHTNPGIDRVKRVADALGVTIDELVRESEEQEDEQ